MRIPQDVRQVVSTERLTRSSARDSNLRAAVSVAAYAAAAVLAVQVGNPLVWVLAWLVMGLVLSGTFAAVHEAIHGSLYDSQVANDVAGVLWGLPVLNPYAAYRSFHFQHHVHTHEPGDSEPVLRVTNIAAYLAVFPAAMVGLNAILWWDQVRILAGRPPVYARRTGRRGLAAANTAAFLALFAGLAWWGVADVRSLLALWVVPLVLGSVLAALYSTPEHYGTQYGPASPFVVSRTIHSNPLTRFLVWNANYHVAHHLCPTVTGRNLPRLQAVIDDRCEVRARSYTQFHTGLMADLVRGRTAETVPERFAATDAERIADLDAAHPVEYAEAAGDRSGLPA